MAALLALAGVVAVMLATAPAAKAGDVPAICAQYPDLPQCENPAGGGGGNNENPGGGGPGAIPGGGGGPSAEAGSGGELPFTGYPVTPLILLALLLLLLGLMARIVIEIRDRIRARLADTRTA